MRSIIINRSILEPIRDNLSRHERWNGYDKGLISCWENGRLMAIKNPELAERAKKSELPMLNWKGGVSKKIQIQKYGSFQYLAQWQGLRNENLNINSSIDKEIICSLHNQSVIFTSDIKKFSE